MVLLPSARAMLAEAVPLATVTPFTRMLAVPSVRVGVNVIELLANGTVAV
jgi:ABC-type antimicrobial peptide transport system permease subunit